MILFHCFSKVVVRHLPPSMTEEQFLDQVSPLPDNNYIYFAKADPSMGQFAFSRAYVNFLHQEDIYIFKDKFDGYVFIDSKGSEYPASVEFAPFQRVPRRRFAAEKQTNPFKARDSKCGTIEKDPEYIQFLESMEEIKNEANLPSAEVYLEEMEAKEKELRANRGCPRMTTPLIEYVLARRLQRSNENRGMGKKVFSSDAKRDEKPKKVAEKPDRAAYKDKPLPEKEKGDRPDKKPRDRHRNRNKDKPREDKKVTSGLKTHKETSNDGERNFAPKSVLQKEVTPKEQKVPSAPKEKGPSHEKKAPPPKEPRGESSRSDQPQAPVKKGYFKEKREREKEARGEREQKARDNDKERADRVRNKDRPAQQIYRPGSKKADGTPATPEGEPSALKEVKEKLLRPRVFRNKKPDQQ